MRSLVAAEFLKLRTTPSAPVTLTVAALLAVGMPVIYGAAAGTGDIAALSSTSIGDMVRGPSSLIGGAMLLVGLLLAAGEYRHRTVLTSRLQEPRPSRLLAAKAIAMASLGLVVGFVLQLVALAAASATLSAHHVAVQPFGHGAGRALVVLPVAYALQAVLGVAIGALLRNTAAAVGATLMWAFVVEGAVPVLSRRPELAGWLPSGLLREVASGHAAAGHPAPAAAVALLLGWAAIVLGASAVLDRTREL